MFIIYYQHNHLPLLISNHVIPLSFLSFPSPFVVLELFPTLYTTQSRRSYFGATAGFTKPDISLQSSKTNGSFAGAGAANLAAAFGVPGSATGFSAFGFSDPTDSGRPSLRRAVWAPYLRFGPVRRDSACVVDVERLARLNRIDALLAMEFAFITSTDLTAVLKRIHYLSSKLAYSIL